MLIEVRRFHRRARQRPDPGQRRTDPRRLPGLGRLLRLLRSPLHGAHGLLGLVGVTRDSAVLPGPLPLCLPRQPRDAVDHRLSRVAHGHRRLAYLRGKGGQAPQRGRHRHPGPGRGPPRRRGGGSRRRRPGDRLRSGGRRHSRRHRPAAAGRSHAPGARPRWVRSATPETRPGCTPTTTCSRPRPAPGRRGTTCSRPATPARTASWSPTT